MRPAADSQVARAHQVFGQVSAVADKNNRRLPKLVVVNNRSSPWAIALPDGNIVLSKKAVTTTHLTGSILDAEARLAFILGHELAHLAHDDFWHREIYRFSITRPKSKDFLGMPSAHEISERELKADDKGFIYAALAGFPVERLLQTNQHTADFFTLWKQQTNKPSDTPHNTAETREEKRVRSRIANKLKRMYISTQRQCTSNSQFGT